MADERYLPVTGLKTIIFIILLNSTWILFWLLPSMKDKNVIIAVWFIYLFWLGMHWNRNS